MHFFIIIIGKVEKLMIKFFSLSFFISAISANSPPPSLLDKACENAYSVQRGNYDMHVSFYPIIQNKPVQKGDRHL